MAAWTVAPRCVQTRLLLSSGTAAAGAGRSRSVVWTREAAAPAVALLWLDAAPRTLLVAHADASLSRIDVAADADETTTTTTGPVAKRARRYASPCATHGQPPHPADAMQGVGRRRLTTVLEQCGRTSGRVLAWTAVGEGATLGAAVAAIVAVPGGAGSAVLCLLQPTNDSGGHGWMATVTSAPLTGASKPTALGVLPSVPAALRELGLTDGGAGDAGAVLLVGTSGGGLLLWPFAGAAVPVPYVGLHVRRCPPAAQADGFKRS